MRPRREIMWSSALLPLEIATMPETSGQPLDRSSVWCCPQMPFAQLPALSESSQAKAWEFLQPLSIYRTVPPGLARSFWPRLQPLRHRSLPAPLLPARLQAVARRAATELSSIPVRQSRTQSLTVQLPAAAQRAAIESSWIQTLQSRPQRSQAPRLRERPLAARQPARAISYWRQVRRSRVRLSRHRQFRERLAAIWTWAARMRRCSRFRTRQRRAQQ